MKIALISFFDTNLGEELIQDCAKFLIKKAAAQKYADIELKIHGLFPFKERLPELNIFRRNIELTSYFIFKKCGFLRFLEPVFTFTGEFAAILKWHFQQQSDERIKTYYDEIAQSADVVVSAGGGFLSHFDLNLWAPFYGLLCACERNKTPLYINCLGVETPSAAFSLLFRSIFSKKCIKHVTIRDNIQTAQKFCSKKVQCKLAGDSALWSGECYGIRRSDSGTVGVNIIREGIFLDNNGSLTPAQVKNAYINLVNTLLARGFDVQLFTNGLYSDEELAKKVQEESNLKKSPNGLAPCPKTGFELAKTISNYHAIIGARMHCAIAAVSLDIPCIEVLWKPKQVHFAQLINRSGWFFAQEKFLDSEYVADLLEKAIEQGYNREIVDDLRSRTLENIQENLF